MSGKGDIVSNTTDGLADGSRVGHMELRRGITSIRTGVVTAQIDGNGAGDEDISRGISYAGFRRRRR